MSLLRAAIGNLLARLAQVSAGREETRLMSATTLMGFEIRSTVRGIEPLTGVINLPCVNRYVYWEGRGVGRVPRGGGCEMRALRIQRIADEQLLQ